ncbi:MAG TPA: tyrosine-type recombinase/integrase [Oculatellaceae cyanobacterium]|jgi:type 1 fimbriae regulatory protein FimB
MPSPPLKTYSIKRRPREFLYPHEITALIQAARKSRNPQRDSTLLMLAFCHALQPIEVVALTWQHINFAEKFEPFLPTLTIYRNRRRGKNSRELIPDIQFLCPAEVKALRQLAREYKGATWLFPSECRTVLSARSLHHIVKVAGTTSGLEFPIHPYMLRHSGAIYRAALLLSKSPEVTLSQCHLVWQKFGTVNRLSVQELQQVKSIDQRTVDSIWQIIERIRSFIGVNSYLYAAKYIFSAFEAYPNSELLPKDFWLSPPQWQDFAEG